jgi:tRNA nucleotidyltransferase (CCA-adding enzyme)
MTYPFFKVGGCVRDEFLGVKSKDIDYAVEAPSYNAMRDAILARGGKIFLETPDKFTIRANVPNLGACDYVLCREEGPYSDGRRPDWVRPGDIYADLSRRDFTMNAIAISEDGKVLDPHDGRADIAKGVIRAVGNPRQRMVEDKLRSFRAARFTVTKKMTVEGELYQVIQSLDTSNGAFDGVSTERIQQECEKAFAYDSFRAFEVFSGYPELWKLVKARGIWFIATTKKS